MSLRYFTASFLLVGSLLVSSCNLFEAFHEEGGSKNPDVLLTDARFALRDGRYDQAVRILERAHAIDPAHAAVRVELSSALLKANDLSILDIVRVADNVTEGAAEAHLSKTSAVAACSFPPGALPVGTFNYADVASYQKLTGNSPIFERIVTLLSPLLPEEIRDLTVDDEVDFDGLIQAIRSTNLTGTETNTLLLTQAIALVVTSYVRIFDPGEDGPDAEWYVVQNEQGWRYIGFCAQTEADKAQIEQRAACAISDLHTAVILLLARAATLHNANMAGAIADQAADALAMLRHDLESGSLACN